MEVHTHTTHKHARAHTHIHTYMLAHIHAHEGTHTHTHHTHTHTHTHTPLELKHAVSLTKPPPLEPKDVIHALHTYDCVQTQIRMYDIYMQHIHAHTHAYIHIKYLAYSAAATWSPTKPLTTN